MKSDSRITRSGKAAVSAAALLGAAALALFGPPRHVIGQDPAAAPTVPPAAHERLEDLSNAFKSVFKSVKPSVVSVSMTRRFKNPLRRGGSLGSNDSDSLNQFFGRGFDEQLQKFFGERAQRQAPEQHGLGSGVIVSPDGYILTNNHVVAQADEVEVRISDARTFKAKIVGTDPNTDLAVLKIDADNLVAAKLGDSTRMEIGDIVLAIGSPFGLEETLTQGIVSATSRNRIGILDPSTGYEDFIQTDAAINPGNSGGPLINLHGEVVGINTAIASGSGASAGVGFAIPMSMAETVMNSLIKEGRVVRGSLGVYIQDVDADMAAQFGAPSTAGALVADVMKGGAGEKAGLKTGDIITAINGRPCANVNQLRNTVASNRPGTTIELTVLREGREQKISATLQELKSNKKTDESDDDSDQRGAEPASVSKLGFSVEALTPEMASQLNAEGAEGVVITSVEPGSPASSKGLQPGFIITKVGERSIKTVTDFNKAVKEVDLKKGALLQILSEGAKRFYILKSND